MTRESDKGGRQRERLQEREIKRVESLGKKEMRGENQGASEKKHGQSRRVKEKRASEGKGF